MSQVRKLRCYEYVNRPFASVRELLHREPLELLQRATRSAAVRAGALAANLHVDVGGIEIGVDVRPHIERVRDDEYRPPLGALGNAMDTAVGHRIAEASIHRLLEDVVEQMKRDLPEGH